MVRVVPAAAADHRHVAHAAPPCCERLRRVRLAAERRGRRLSERISDAGTLGARAEKKNERRRQQGREIPHGHQACQRQFTALYARQIS